MQQNLVVSAFKLIALTAFAVFLGLNFFATQNLEEKVMRSRDTLNGLKEGVAETNRRVDRAAQAAQEAKEAAQAAYERLDGLLDALERGVALEPRRSTGGPAPAAGKPKPQPAARRGKPSRIAGKEIWPRNPGWTVLCDKDANADPKRDIPAGRVDWDATLFDYVTGEPKGLNWYSDDRTVTVVTLARYCAEQLAERKTTDWREYNAKLAERIEESPDRKQYLIYLRRGVFWHRPALDLDEYPWLDQRFEVNARDVKYTLDIIRDPNVISPLKPYFDEVERVEIVDDYTVRVTWKRANFYARDTMLTLRPYPRHIMAYDRDGTPYDEASIGAAFNNHWFSKSICGNGPYRFVEYRKGESFRFERNENYYGPRATCKELRFQIITDNETRLQKFWNREIVTISLAAEQYRRVILEGETPHPVHRYEKFDEPAPPSWKTVYFIWRRPVYGGFAWNQRREPFRDRRVRKAMTLALNRYAVVEKMFYGLGEVIPIGESVFSIYFNKNLENLPFDLDAARQELDAAGWKDTDGDGIRDKKIDGVKRDLEFELVIAASSSIQTQIAQMFKEDLLKCGVRLKQMPVDAALWAQKNSERDFDGLIIFWYAGVDSDPRQLWASEYADQPGSNNYTGFRDEEADRIFDELTTTFDYPTRIELMHRWYEIQFREQPYTWIWSVHSPMLIDADWRVPEPKLPPPYVDRRLIFKWKKR